jgi:hypothetical protein
MTTPTNDAKVTVSENSSEGVMQKEHRHALFKTIKEIGIQKLTVYYAGGTITPREILHGTADTGINASADMLLAGDVGWNVSWGLPSETHTRIKLDDMTVKEAVTTLIKDELALRHPDWQTGLASYGKVEFDVPSHTVSLMHNQGRLVYDTTVVENLYPDDEWSSSDDPDEEDNS